MTTSKVRRRDFLSGGLAATGLASCRPSLPALAPAVATAPQSAPANTYIPLEVIDPTEATSLLGSTVELTQNGGVIIRAEPEVVAGVAVASRLAHRMPRELQISHQLAYRDPSAGERSPNRCRWDLRSRISLEGPLNARGFQPDDGVSKEPPRIRELLIGARWVRQTSCRYEQLEEGIVAIAIGGVAGPPGRVDIRSRDNGFIDVIANTTPWTRVVVHARDHSSRIERLVWASTRHQFIRRLSGQVHSRVSMGGYIATIAPPFQPRAATFTATFLAWEAPDIATSVLANAQRWRATLRTLSTQHYRIASVVVDP